MLSSTRRGRRRATAAAIALGLGCVLAAAPHAAAVVVTPVTAGQLAAAIAAYPGLVTGAAYVHLGHTNPATVNSTYGKPPYADPPGGPSTAVATHPIGGLPRHGSAFAILSTGKARDVEKDPFPEGDGTDLGTYDPAGAPGRGSQDRDVTILRLDLNLPRGTNCLTFDFRFYTDEWDQIARGFHDAFVAELDATTWLSTQTSKGVEVLARNNFATDPDGGPITAHALGKTDWIQAEEAAGTGYNGATPLLRAAAPTGPGKHRLYLSIFDSGDSDYDSAVIVDNLRATKSTECLNGVVPLPPG